MAAHTQEGIVPGFVTSEDLVQGGVSIQLPLIPAVVSMGSADHRLNLAEILSQNYGVREEREEDDTQEKQKSLEELEKTFSASQVKAAREGKGNYLLDFLVSFYSTGTKDLCEKLTCSPGNALCLSPPINKCYVCISIGRNGFDNRCVVA